MRNFYSIKKQANIFRSSILLLAIASLFSLKINAQCPPGNVTLATQAQVNQFVIDYPNCAVISGFLKMQVGSGTSDITDLSALHNITTVTGNLEFNNNQLLQNINGLSHITTIGGSLAFANNGLQNINGLSALQSVGGYIYVAQNNALQNLNGLHSVNQITGHIDISNNNLLTNISGLQNISPSIAGLTIQNNALLSICNLSNFCTYLANPAGTHPRNIVNNAGDCISEQAVVAACNAPAAGCLQSSLAQWPANTFTPSCTGSAEVIAPNAWTGEYSKVQLTAGNEYTFSSSVATDFITISNEDGTTAYMFGTSSVTGTATVNETVRFYLHLDSLCNSGDNVDRSRMVQCIGNSSVSELDTNKLSYYPNPVTDVLNIANDKIITDVSVINILGKTVMSKTVNSTTTQIDMTSLPSGNYFIKVTLDGMIKTVTVVKQ
jgi:hypothetical protein